MINIYTYIIYIYIFIYIFIHTYIHIIQNIYIHNILFLLLISDFARFWYQCTNSSNVTSGETSTGDPQKINKYFITNRSSHRRCSLRKKSS